MRNFLIFILSAQITWGLFAQSKKPELTLEDIFKYYRFYPYYPDDFESMNDGEHYTNLNYGSSIDKYEFRSGEKVETLFPMPNPEDSLGYIESYAFNAEESKILLEVNKESIYRHSFRSDYYVYDIQTKKVTPVFKKDKIQLATFAPGGNKITFVWENNLYIKNLLHDSIQQITNDGKKNQVINGMPDWVYEEEFGFTKAFAWSPDGKKLAYLRFDESEVSQFPLIFYDSLYPEIYLFKYPKSGEKNSVVSVHLFDVETNKSISIPTGDETVMYIPRILWTEDKEKLAIITLNRLQNHVEVILADATTGNITRVYSEDEDQYISEITDDYITFTEDNKYFLVKSERDGYMHLYRYTLDGELINQVTIGEWEIKEVLGIQNNETLYYSGYDSSPLRTAVFSIALDGTNKEKISQQTGINNAFFSKGYKYYIHFHRSSTNPGYVTLHNKQHALIRVIENVDYVKEAMEAYGFTPKEFFTFKNSRDIELYGFMIKPPDFNKKKKYPLFMYVYGGPEYQSVTDDTEWNDAWFQYLAKKGYIVACVDGQGSGGRGEAFRKSVYMNLGKNETMDQMEAAKYLGTLPYIDKNRIGIFGWSYGGYLSLLCLSKAVEIFKMAIAVAPITNWRFYDTIYTERYMRTPQENPEGYDDNSPINYIEKIQGKLLLLHGMTDDNVHLQNSAELIEKLVQENKQFNMQFYPNKNHSIYGGNTTLHLYTCMTEFILENL